MCFKCAAASGILPEQIQFMSTAVGTHPTTPTTATTGKPVTVGTPGMLWSVRKDHDDVRRNIENMLTMTDLDAKQRLFNDTVKMLAQHDVAEEVVCLKARILKLTLDKVIYPAAQRIGDESLYKLALDQTVQMERMLYDVRQ